MSFFGGVGEILLTDKVESCPIYAQLMEIIQTRNWWDQGVTAQEYLEHVIMDNEVIGSGS